MSRGAWKSSFSPESRGTVVGYCRKYTVGMALGVAAVVDIVLGLAEIVPASCQSLRAAWSSLLEVRSSICGAVAFGGPRRSKSCVHQRGWGTRRS